MKEVIGKIKENKEIATETMKMVLEIPDLDIHPGQFVNIAIPEKFLRRPISICDGNKNEITLIYKIVGKGTEDLSQMEAGVELNLLTELGNGYDMAASGDKPLLIGGGAGVPPLYYLAKELLKEGKTPTVILGFNFAQEVFLEEEFKALGCETIVTTVDGSLGIKGFVTDGISPEGGYTYYYACGPEPMLKAVYDALDIDGEMSFETRMGCGYGACMGCSALTKNGEKRLCKEGPVLKKEEIALWED